MLVSNSNCVKGLKAEQNGGSTPNTARWPINPKATTGNRKTKPKPLIRTENQQSIGTNALSNPSQGPMPSLDSFRTVAGDQCPFWTSPEPSRAHRLEPNSPCLEQTSQPRTNPHGPRRDLQPPPCRRAPARASAGEREAKVAAASPSATVDQPLRNCRRCLSLNRRRRAQALAPPLGRREQAPSHRLGSSLLGEGDGRDTGRFCFGWAGGETDFGSVVKKTQQGGRSV